MFANVHGEPSRSHPRDVFVLGTFPTLCRLVLCTLMDVVTPGVSAASLSPRKYCILSCFQIKSSDASTLVCFKCLELVEDYHKFYTLVKKSQLSFGQKSEDMPYSYDEVKVEKEEDDSLDDCNYDDIGEVRIFFDDFDKLCIHFTK